MSINAIRIRLSGGRNLVNAFQGDGVDGLIEAIGRFALESNGLSKAISSICRSCNSEGAALLQVGPRTRDAPFTESIGALYEKYFAEGWHARDLRERGMPRMMREGIAVDQDFVTMEMMSRDPYYQEFLAPLGYRWFAGLAISAGDGMRCLALQRTPRQGEFDAAQQRVLLRLRAPISQITSIQEAIEFSRLHGVLSGLDAVGTPAIALSRNAQVVKHNEAAERLMGKTFRVIKRRIETVDPRANRDLSSLSDKLRSGLIRFGNESSVVFVRVDSRPVLVIRYIPLPLDVQWIFSGAVVLAILDRISGPDAHSIDTLARHAFSLTPAESRLASQMLSGLSLREAAERNSTTIETARTQLKALLGKTSTRRQSELVVLLQRLQSLRVPGPGSE